MGVSDISRYEDRLQEIRAQMEDPRHILGRVIAPPDGAPVLDGMTYLRDVPWLLDVIGQLQGALEAKTTRHRRRNDTNV